MDIFAIKFSTFIPFTTMFFFYLPCHCLLNLCPNYHLLPFFPAVERWDRSSQRKPTAPPSCFFPHHSQEPKTHDQLPLPTLRKSRGFELPKWLAVVLFLLCFFWGLCFSIIWNRGGRRQWQEQSWWWWWRRRRQRFWLHGQGSMGTMSDWSRSWENEIYGLIPMVGLSV